MEHILETVIEIIVPVLELMGIFIVAETAIENFIRYIYCMLTRRPSHVKVSLAKGLMLGLEFMMVAEILKSVTVRNLTDLLVLGGVVVLRAILAFELKQEEKEEEE